MPITRYTVQDILHQATSYWQHLGSRDYQREQRLLTCLADLSLHVRRRENSHSWVRLLSQSGLEEQELMWVVGFAMYLGHLVTTSLSFDQSSIES